MAGWGDGAWGDSGWGGFVAYDSTIDETSTGTDAVVAKFDTSGLVGETATGSDVIAAGKIFTST